ncbi:MAG: aminotransferase class V-fold PLP-dependent enzyme [Candidatus Marinarcus sp.]|uniref:aminotransferase class V-fold PLP-dependent enzyme n=1 Tax=Candidatus Marinarcus sp. TaxID=3100987 RepID=UPI003B008235
MYKEVFPYFQNSSTIYLDNAATTQKPQDVIDAITEYYTHYCANTHRSSFGDANRATQEFEKARETIKEYIHAQDVSEIIFTKGVTESINFVATSFAKRFETIIISSLEHHSNIVPWQMQEKILHYGLEVVNCDENLDFDMAHFEMLLKTNPSAFVSITHVSNAFGKIHALKEIIQLAHKYNTFVLVDMAQSLAHFPIDVTDLDADFVALSSHKTFGPTGVGVLYVKKEHLIHLNAYQTGGATINDVSYEQTILLDSPYKYEAGTQNIAGVIGFKAALDFLNKMNWEEVQTYEKALYEYAHKELSKLDDILFYNTLDNCIGSLSFNINNINCEDIGILLDKQHIAVRTGHHCAQPIMKHLNIKGTVRISLAFYNTKEEIDQLIIALNKTIGILKD